MKKNIYSFFFVVLAWSIAGCPDSGKIRKKMPRLFTINFVMETGAEPSFMTKFSNRYVFISNYTSLSPSSFLFAFCIAWNKFYIFPLVCSGLIAVVIS